MSTPVLHAGLTGNSRPGRVIIAITLIGFFTLPVSAQRVPREDVIDVIDVPRSAKVCA